MAKFPKVSVVILGYRAEKNLIPLIKRLTLSLNTLDLTYEIILVANYWPFQNDLTPSIAKNLARKHPNLSIITKAKEGGMGWDMREGFKIARGKIIAVLDGDTQNPIEDVAKAIQTLVMDPTLDLIKAKRIKRYDGLYRVTQSKVYNLLFALLFRSNPLNDINAKPKAFTRKAYIQLNLISNDWFIDAEIMLQALKLRLNIREFETEFYKNPYRSSFVNLKTALEFIRNLVWYRLTQW